MSFRLSHSTAHCRHRRRRRPADTPHADIRTGQDKICPNLRQGREDVQSFRITGAGSWGQLIFSSVPPYTTGHVLARHMGIYGELRSVYVLISRLTV
ncbi:hypothetical protein J6590_038544 [Homalodisca vitripennis]|nr:hypothetical protein J6590_038544 [Homalodisca vitripennis]